ncbi:MAG: methyltransferase domain-containing protein [Gammaproteobacteria bacterium]|nr:methyltransferase domain-containing protein [Gammaproteobacteria bacterium]
MRDSSHDDSEYYDAMLDLLEWIWGEGYMAPGGEGNVDKLVAGLELRGKKVLDLGCGLGGPVFVLAKKYGAIVTGTDLESKLISRATTRAAELDLSDRTTFVTVEAGPMDFPDDHFDLVISSGAITQIDDKLGIFREINRILKPGGVISCYNWMKSAGEYSEDMLYWFKMEGLTYAMETPGRHGELLAEAGFRDIQLKDASDWYRREAQREHELLSGKGYSKVVNLIGRSEADHLIESWRAMVIVCDKGEMLQGYCRAVK